MDTDFLAALKAVWSEDPVADTPSSGTSLHEALVGAIRRCDEGESPDEALHRLDSCLERLEGARTTFMGASQDMPAELAECCGQIGELLAMYMETAEALGQAIETLSPTGEMLDSLDSIYAELSDCQGLLRELKPPPISLLTLPEGSPVRLQAIHARLLAYLEGESDAASARESLLTYQTQGRRELERLATVPQVGPLQTVSERMRVGLTRADQALTVLLESVALHDAVALREAFDSLSEAYLDLHQADLLT